VKIENFNIGFSSNDDVIMRTLKEMRGIFLEKDRGNSSFKITYGKYF